MLFACCKAYYFSLHFLIWEKKKDKKDWKRERERAREREREREREGERERKRKREYFKVHYMKIRKQVQKLK